MLEISPDRDEWLTLREAARRLNVHPTTLRRWATNGEIPVMLTPGGHRRFAASDVANLAQKRHVIRRSRDVEQVFTDEAIAHTRKEIGRPTEPKWLSRLDDKSRSRHRKMGRRLMDVMRQYISETDEATALLDEARKIGRDYGQSFLDMNLPLADALKASMFFRDALVETTIRLPEKVRLRPEAKTRLLQRVNALLNTVQLAVAEVYDADKKNRLPGS